MLTPIPVVRSMAGAAPAGDTTANVRESGSGAQNAASRGVDALTKILSIISRTLSQTDSLSRQSLVPLLETLAKVLKLAPQPGESLRAFAARLVTSLEQMPPAARLALERQLVLRNLVVSLEGLVEALKAPPTSQALRVVMPFIDLTAPRRATNGATADQKPQTPMTGRTMTPLPAPSPALAAGQTAPPTQTALLQAVLKVYDGEGDHAPRGTTGTSVSAEDSSVIATRTDAAKAGADRRTPATFSAALSLPAGQAAGETIPHLHAAAAFLAGDPEALALALAATSVSSSGDDDIKAALVQDLGLTVAEADAMAVASDAATATFEPPASPQSEPESTENEPTAADPANISDRRQGASSSGAVRLPVGEPGLSADTMAHSRADAGAHGQSGTAFVPPNERASKLLAETLKALVETGLPLPGPALPGSVLPGSVLQDPLRLAALTAGRSAADDAAMALAPRTAQPEALGPQSGEDADANRIEDLLASSDSQDQTDAAWRQSPIATASEDLAANLLSPRPQDTVLLREAIAFAMIPYLPAAEIATDDTETDDTRRDGGDEEDDDAGEDREEGQDAPGDGHRRHDDAERRTAQHPTEDTDDDADISSGSYDLYSRMSGLV